MTIEVRAVTAVEAATHADALARIVVDCVKDGASIGFLSPFSAADAGGWWQTVFAAVKDGRTALLMAFDAGVPVGTAQLALDGPCNGRHRADVRKVMVAPDRQGKGIGRLLMQAVEEEARRHRRLLMVLDTVPHTAAYHLYRRLGWQEVGIIPDYARFPDGRLCDTALFYKRLA